MTLAQSALDGYAYLDLEVDGNGQIFSYGLLFPRHELKVRSGTDF
ncbi:hypothetical protein [Phormidium sp. FACHB-1136]|jgi:hypothetical protein|nr:hypothetical protein [Phormidium sp. FACHB-1136]